ncbi:MAG TPA: alpha/beta hydrolase [Pseudonocardiaceae bacterium]
MTHSPLAHRTHRQLAVPVPGGTLAVHRWAADRPDAPVLIAAHGITGNGLSWAAIADALPDHDVIVPDLRGRAGSRAVSGPYGLARHAEDLVLVLDHLGITAPVVLAGHSMGGFVACLAAATQPRRFRKVVLVDGGLGFPTPEGVDTDAVLAALVGPAIQRLEMEFPSVEAYREFWRRHPAFGDIWNDRTIEYLDHDLIGEPPQLRSSCVGEAIRADGADVIRDPDTLAAIHHLPVSTTLLWAERGMLNQPEGLYSRRTLAALPARIEARLVPGTNHYSIVIGDGARAVAEAVTEP